ncbi:MAG: TOBE domain-containing protein [Ilumatobacteraceae bacterium]
MTHDQVEAMTMGHRVAVLKDGQLQQCDTPQSLYHQPANRFVAGFIGSPAMNILDVVDDGTVRLGSAAVAFAATDTPKGVAAIGFRPEAATLGSGPVAGRIRTVEDLGSEVFVHVALDGNADASIVVKVSPPFTGKAGDQVQLQLHGLVHAFDSGGLRVSTGPATFQPGV